MVRRQTTRTWIGTIVFLLVMVEIGIALQTGTRLRNPFQVFSEIVTLKDEVGRLDAVQERTNVEPSTPGVSIVGTGLNDITLRWSDFRGVLFDWWFIIAVSAVMMLVGRPIGAVIKRLRPSKRRPMRER